MGCRFSDERIMEHISNLINTASLSVKREERQSSQTLDPHVTDIVNKIFVFFYSICRGFDKQYQDPKRLNVEKTQWIRAFMDVGFKTLEQIQLGIKKCRIESPINTPTIGQFIKWCTATTEDMGLLTKEQAFNRSSEFIREGNLSDLSVEQNILLKHAIKESDRFFLKNNPMSKTQPVFYRNYEIVLRDFINGKLKPISKAIEDNNEETYVISNKQALNKEFGHLTGYEQCMPQLRKMLGINPDGTIDKPTKR